MFCCTLLCVRSSIAIVLMGKRELVALLNLSSWCLVMVEWLFLAMPQGCLRFVIVVLPDHAHLLFLILCRYNVDTLIICMKKFIVFVELRQLFPYMAFVYAWIVPLWADQLLSQLLIEQ